MTEKQETPVNEPANGPAATSPDERDRRKGARRTGKDRRAGTTAPAGTERRESDRRTGERREDPPVADLYRAGQRSVNEYPLSPAELEFINALTAYKTKHNRPFPTWSEVLHVLKALGYRRRSGGGATNGGSA